MCVCRKLYWLIKKLLSQISLNRNKISIFNEKQDSWTIWNPNVWDPQWKSMTTDSQTRTLVMLSVTMVTLTTVSLINVSIYDAIFSVFCLWETSGHFRVYHVYGCTQLYQAFSLHCIDLSHRSNQTQKKNAARLCGCLCLKHVMGLLTVFQYGGPYHDKLGPHFKTLNK